MQRINAIISGLRRFPSYPLDQAFLVLTVWSTYLLPVLVEGVAVSHVFGILLALVCARKIAARTSREATNTFLIFFFILTFSVASASLVGFQVRFPFELVKTIIVFAVAFFVGLTVRPDRLRMALEPSPWLFIVLMVGVFLFVGKPFAIDGRLHIEGFISSNVLGFLAVLNMAVLVNRPKMHHFDWITLMVLVFIMAMSLSRSAFIGALLLLWVRIGWTRGSVIFGSLAVLMGIIFSGNKVLQRLLVVEDALTTGGSGRTSLWTFLLQNWFETPTAWFFGFGPGAVHRHPNWLATQDNAHSMLIGGLYYWGLVGILFLVGLFTLAWREIIHAPQTPELGLARDIILIVAANCAVDESYNASQINAISALFFALVLAVIVAARRVHMNATLMPAE